MKKLHILQALQRLKTFTAVGPDGKIYGNLTIICEQAQTVKLKVHPSVLL